MAKLQSVYKVSSEEWVEQIDGGRAEGHSPEDYDSEALETGKQVEFEHSDDPDVATEIAMDHLQEFDDYYDGLAAMEEVLREREDSEIEDLDAVDSVEEPVVVESSCESCGTCGYETCQVGQGGISLSRKGSRHCDVCAEAAIVDEDWEDQMPGGLADEYVPSDFDSGALEDGVDVELEHTDDEALAMEIAMDHLVEYEDYYDALSDMEDLMNDGGEDSDEDESLDELPMDLEMGDEMDEDGEEIIDLTAKVADQYSDTYRSQRENSLDVDDELESYVLEDPNWSAMFRNLGHRVQNSWYSGKSPTKEEIARAYKIYYTKAAQMLHQQWEAEGNTFEEFDVEFPETVLNRLAEQRAEEWVSQLSKGKVVDFEKLNQRASSKQAAAPTPYVQDDKEAMGALVAAFNQLKGIAEFANEKDNEELFAKVKKIQEFIRDLAQDIKR